MNSKQVESMAGNHRQNLTLGMLTNGRNFLFIILTKKIHPSTKSFALRNLGNELYTVLSILNRQTQQLLETGNQQLSETVELCNNFLNSL